MGSACVLSQAIGKENSHEHYSGVAWDAKQDPRLATKYLS